MSRKYMGLIGALLLAFILSSGCLGSGITIQRLIGNEPTEAAAPTATSVTVPPTEHVDLPEPSATALPPEPTVTELPPTEVPTPTEAFTPTPLPEPVDSAAIIDGGNNLHFWTRDKGLVPLDSSGDILIARPSMDGKRIAYVRQTDGASGSLWVADSDGSQTRQLLDPQNLAGLASNPDAYGNTPYQIDWVPGQPHVLAFNTRPLFNSPGLIINDDLNLINTDTGELTALVPQGQGGAFSYSPDGRFIAVSSSKRVDIINADGSNRQEGVISFPMVLTYSEWVYYPPVYWAADSQSFLTVIPPEDSLGQPEAATAIWKVSVTDGKAEQMGNVVTQPLRYPQISPDLKRMSYVSEPNPGSNLYELYLADANGANAARYESGFGMWMGWLPDSQRFAFMLASDLAPRLGRVDSPSSPFSDVADVTSIDCFGDGTCLMARYISSGWELRKAQPGGPSELIGALEGQEGSPQVFLSH